MAGVRPQYRGLEMDRLLRVGKSADELRPQHAALVLSHHTLEPIFANKVGRLPTSQLKQMVVCVADGFVVIQQNYYEPHGFEQVSHALFRSVERHFGMGEPGDIAIGSPDALQLAVLDNTPLRSQIVAVV